MVPHSGVLRAGALRRRRLVAHALVAVGRLRHLAAGRQLTPRQLAAAGPEARAVEPAARSAQVPVLHAARLPQRPHVLALPLPAGAGAGRRARRFSLLRAQRRLTAA